MGHNDFVTIPRILISCLVPVMVPWKVDIRPQLSWHAMVATRIRFQLLEILHHKHANSLHAEKYGKNTNIVFVELDKLLSAKTPISNIPWYHITVTSHECHIVSNHLQLEWVFFNSVLEENIKGKLPVSEFST